MPLALKHVVLAVLAGFLLRVRYDWAFRRRVVQAVIASKTATAVLLPIVRFLLGYLIPPALVNFVYVWPTMGSQDGVAYLDHIKYVRRTRYGPHEREELDELLPVEGQEYAHANRTQVFMPNGVLHMATHLASQALHLVTSGFAHHPHYLPTKLGRVKDSAPAILFGHGGGWVCQGTDVQLGQLPSIVRGTGMAVYTFNYALAPEDPYPAGLISCLRALSYLKTHRGYDSVALLGESAGGNLVTMAAMFVCNPELMAKLALAAKLDCDAWDYPHVSCLVSWYSILDHQAWDDPAVEHAYMRGGMNFVWDLYLGKTPALDGKCTVVQWKDEIKAYPPTLSISGSYDPLGICESTKVFHHALSEELQIQGCELKIYTGTHGFVGYPASFQQAISGGTDKHWKEACWQATLDTCQFLKTHHEANLRTRVLGG